MYHVCGRLPKTCGGVQLRLFVRFPNYQKSRLGNLAGDLRTEEDEERERRNDDGADWSDFLRRRSVRLHQCDDHDDDFYDYVAMIMTDQPW